MLKMKKYKNAHNYDVFCIHTSEGVFEISMQGNLDLYWSYSPKESLLECENTKEFTITEEDEFIYKAFDNLYKSVQNETPYSNAKHKSVRKYPDNNTHKLFKDNKIEWHSDDFDYEDASTLTIEKKEHCYKVIFKKSKDLGMFITFMVRLRMSGSRHNPFQIAFMNMYNSLKQYNFDYDQICFEEYLKESNIKRVLKKDKNNE